MLDKNEKVGLIIVSIVILLLITSTVTLLLRNRNCNCDRLVKVQPVKTKIEYINQTEVINWSMSSSTEVVGNDTIKLNCYAPYGSNVIIDFGQEKYAMHWSKFCDKLNDNVRWLFLEDSR